MVSFQNFMCELSKVYGLSELTAADDTKYTLTPAPECKVHLEHPHGDGAIHLYSYLFPALDGYRQELCEKVMSNNAYGKLSHKATISLGGQNNEMFVLAEEIPLASLTITLFKERLAEFVAMMKTLKAKYPDWQLEISMQRFQKSPSNEDLGQGGIKA